MIKPKFFLNASYGLLAASILSNLGLSSVLYPQFSLGCWFIFLLIVIASVIVASFFAYREQRIQYGSISVAAKIPLYAMVIIVVLFFVYGLTLAF
jgi:hypothetical protein